MVERLLRLSEACKRLGTHLNTLRKWDGEGKIRVVGTIGGRRRVPESEVERLMGIVKPDVASLTSRMGTSINAKRAASKRTGT